MIQHNLYQQTVFIIFIQYSEMTSFEKHIEKYKLFLKDAENKSVSHMSRIEAYFFASFHLIEAVIAKNGKHINKHTM